MHSLQPRNLARKFSLSIFVLIWSIVGFSQVNQDSLEKVVTTNPDTIERLTAYRFLSKLDNTQLGLKYSIATINLADSLLSHGYKNDSIVLSHKGSGIWNYYRNRYDQPDNRNVYSALAGYNRASSVWMSAGNIE